MQMNRIFHYGDRITEHITYHLGHLFSLALLLAPGDMVGSVSN